MYLIIYSLLLFLLRDTMSMHIYCVQYIENISEKHVPTYKRGVGYTPEVTQALNQVVSISI